MKNSFLVGLVSLIVIVFCAVGLVHLTNWYERTSTEAATQEQLVKLSANLQEEINYLVTTAETLANKIEHQPEWVYSPLLSPLLADYQPKSYLVATAFTEGLNIVYAHPAKGNESIIGMNLSRRPVHYKAARNLLASGLTNIDGPVVLQQTNDLGLLIHSRYLNENQQPSMVILWVDFPQLLAEAGFDFSQTSTKLLIEAQEHNSEAKLILGKAKDFNLAKQGQKIYFPNEEVWQLRLLTEPNFSRLASQLNYARLLGLTLVFGLLAYLLKTSKVFNTYRIPAEGRSFYSYLLLLILLPASLLIITFTLVASITSEKITEGIMQRQIDQSTDLLANRVEEFLLQPRTAVTNLEAFASRISQANNEQEVLQLFISQLRIQPSLNLISFTQPNNAYLAASRPFIGSDLSLRAIHADAATNQVQHLHWVNDNNQASKDFNLGTPNFLPTQFAWYKQAELLGHLHWYFAKSGEEEAGDQLQAFGLGASLPLSLNNRFLGVLAADISVAKLNSFLSQLSEPSGDSIFLMRPNSQVFASSASVANPLIEEANKLINASKKLNGNKLTYINNIKVLLDWQLIEIVDGPNFILAQIIQSKDIERASLTMLGSIYYLVLACVIMGALVILAANFYITRPLLNLTKWASKLSKGNWHSQLKLDSNIKEINSLKVRLTQMAEELHNHAKTLELRVDERTQELAAANAKLEEISLTDPLTGIANRRRFNYLMLKEWRRSHKQASQLGLLLIDIDWFKKYNDFYGHVKGDEVLIEVAVQLEAAVKSFISTPSLVARYGGEEFAVVLPATNQEEITQLAQHLAATIYDLNIEHQTSDFGRLTLSLGVAAWVANDETNYSQLIEAADQALYLAKQQGRNRYC